MGWFNYYGLIFVTMIMIPNIVYAAGHRTAATATYKNKFAETVEQIGRYGAMAFMVFNIPHAYYGFWFPQAFIVYLAVGGFFVALYCVLWIVFWNRDNKAKALALSVLPSLVFVFCGVMLLSIPLIAAAALFTPAHITISYKNAAGKRR